MHRFQIIPPVSREADPGDILVPTEGNFSILYPPRVVVSGDIRLPTITNSSDLDISGHAKVHVVTGEFHDIVLPAIVNVSEFVGGLAVSAAPSTGNIRLPAIVNSSDLEKLGSPAEALVLVGIAPPDGIIRLPALTNSSVLSFGSPSEAGVTVSEAEATPTDVDDDNDGMVAGGMIAGRTV